MTTRRANDRLAKDLKSLVADAEEFMQATAGEAGEKVNEIRSRLTAALNAAKSTCELAQEKTTAAAKVTDETIREHPYEAIGIAFGVGLVVGLLIPRD